MALIDRLRRAKAALHAAEAEHPGSESLARLHRHGLHLVHMAGEMGALSAAQVAELSEPQGGGAPKTPEPDE